MKEVMRMKTYQKAIGAALIALTSYIASRYMLGQSDRLNDVRYGRPAAEKENDPEQAPLTHDPKGGLSDLEINIRDTDTLSAQAIADAERDYTGGAGAAALLTGASIGYLLSLARRRKT